MSRIGRRPIALPAKVEIQIDGQHIAVKGPKGQLSRSLPPLITVQQNAQMLTVSRLNDSRPARQLHGLCRTLVANMVDGVSKGFERRLELVGVGYRAAIQGSKLVLNVGYSHPVEIPFPPGIQIAVEGNNIIVVSGTDKELVGNTAARIRAVRPPEPYKGKGIRYLGEQVRRKAGKSGKAKK
ncbi:50S ribosomal protein L6 [Synechococcus sp. R55.6]|jgi:large subunit ribosomal protein L6|uniref:Large ribosomal subunit protein uL6 n=2 Tax=unclassified Synechococcus TaxID=2626047 RepID=RL6_SYNJB|nr:50S ribosomal protein L6 [Synechococcus sp. JA-2-3B'a(2-13)]Q2JIL3.1 RecName: Full=Large ribosomal subunit protein uL6; AltName: Full=50S ribosomal protein L6 [Synechococcus sp. JA-2-3B'a(2-13)]ABD03541.1 ribosomal protein L6 [Synechococcus sp. JA-2-3B'a(2-13)]MDT7945043.1 50S ribosomal protein L6 [Cyanobacteriota bacterium PSP.bin.10]